MKEKLFETIVSERKQIQQLRLVVYRLSVLTGVEKEQQVLYTAAVSDLLQEMVHHSRGFFGLGLVDRDDSLMVESVILSLNPGNWEPGSTPVCMREGFDVEVVGEKMMRVSVASGSRTSLPGPEQLETWNDQLSTLMDFQHSSEDAVPAHTVLSEVPIRDYSDGQLQNMQEQLDEANRAVFDLLDQLDEKNRELSRVRQEARSSRKQADTAERARKEFLYQMSHEIRTPLNAIIGMVDLLEESDLTSEQQHYVEVFEQASEDLLDLVNDLFDLSRIEAGVMDVSRESVQLQKLVNQVLEMFRDRADEKGIDLNAVIESTCPDRVITDPRHLEQILVNLVRNAVDSTDEGHVKVRVQEGAKTGEQILLNWEIIDTGEGQARQDQSHVFDSFRAYDTLRKPEVEAERGLSVTRRLVEVMDGAIEVERVSGRGSTFRFHIPVRQAGEREEDGPSDPEEDGGEEVTKSDPGTGRGSGKSDSLEIPPSKRPVRLLIAEDNDVNRRVLEMYLRDRPVEIDFAVNGDETLERFQDGTYDLIFMDLRMPVTNGFEATAKIRKLEDRQDLERTPIVALTAEARGEQKRESSRAGCDAHIVKPVTRDQVVGVLTRFLGEEGDRESMESMTGTGTEEKTPPDDVSVVEEFRDLVPEFVREAREDLESMREALENGETESLADLGHKMKGAAGFYKFDRVVEWSKEIEDTADEGDLDRIATRIEQLSERIERIERELT